MAFQINSPEDYEFLCSVRLTKEKRPIAFENKVQEIIEEQECNREFAENLVSHMKIELELYYEKGKGLFAVESEAVECGTIFSPYTGELGEVPEDMFNVK